MTMLNTDCASPYLKLLQDSPDFRLTKTIPEGMAPQIEAAVKEFIKDSHVPKGVDIDGFYYQTLQSIANITVMLGTGEFWIGTLNDELVTYLLCHIGNDYDGKLAYTVTQAWVRKDQRGKKWVKDAWATIRQRAKDCFCKHFVVISSRGKTDAYCRFLGKGFHYYAEILKEEI